jgi:hypothetical protein
VNAQLYSSGNNIISGHKVGIGINNPESALHIKDFSLSMSGVVFNVPLIRLQSYNSNLLPASTNYFDLRMDNTSALSFWYHSNSNPSSKALELNYNAVKIYSKLVVGDKAEYGEGFTPNGMQGSFISLGLKQLGTAGAWMGSGATMFTTSTGEFQLMTNPTAVVSGTANMTNQIRLMAHHSGVSINSTNLPTGYSFSVKGDAIFDKVVVRTYSTWPDYIFSINYNLRSLTDVKSFITQNGHLPGVPSAKEVEEDGINVAEMNAVLLKKVEELTLYLIELEERLVEMEKSQ